MNNGMTIALTLPSPCLKIPKATLVQANLIANGKVQMQSGLALAATQELHAEALRHSPTAHASYNEKRDFDLKSTLKVQILGPEILIFPLRS